jgi:CRISPR/Cas system-associated exonuclease Cas4 (RecB family)
MTATSELLLQWDQTRPRSQQRQFGMSELGGCERRAGYRLAGQEPTNAGGSVQAVLGTAIHEAVASVLKAVAAPGDLVEHKVQFAGILGHLDRYEAASATLIDVKTTSSRWLEHIKLHGPDRAHRWQVAAYAAALITQQRKVRTVRIDYIARDTGEEWSWQAPFNPQDVREALAWVARVRSVDVSILAREYDPESTFCQHCPFLDVCWEGAPTARQARQVLYHEDPDASKWAARLLAAREAKAAAEEEEKRCTGALQALLPSEEKGTHTVDVGLDQLLKFTVSYPQRLDAAAVKAEYAKTGAAPPYKPSSQPTVAVGFAAREQKAAA